jgi:hypothetical protein
MNLSLANWVEHEAPDLLKREGLRSRRMTAGEFVPQTHETPFALFVVNCMGKEFDSKRYHDTTGRTLYLTNTALTVGVEITEVRIAAYRASRGGDKKQFATSSSPRQQARDSVFTTSGFCCVSVDDNKNLVGTCQKCIKKMGWNCPSVLNVRGIIEGFSDNEDPSTLMGVYSVGAAKRNGNSQSEFLSGRAKAKNKKKSTLLTHDPGSWLKSRTLNFLYEACLGLMILPKREAGAINPSKFKQRPELIAQLVAFADDPQAFRKNQEHQRSADREMGAYGYADFTSVLYEQMDEQKKDKLGRLKTNKEEDDISCDNAEEGFAETAKDNSGKSALPFTITQEDTQVDDEL